MMDLKPEGKSIKEVARMFEVGPRRVQRSLNAVTSQESEVGTDN
jgi:transposase